MAMDYLFEDEVRRFVVTLVAKPGEREGEFLPVDTKVEVFYKTLAYVEVEYMGSAYRLKKGEFKEVNGDEEYNGT